MLGCCRWSNLRICLGFRALGDRQDGAKISQPTLSWKPPPRISLSRPAKIPLKSTFPKSAAGRAWPLMGAFGVSLLLLRSCAPLLGKVGNMLSCFGLGSWRKYSCSNISLAEGLLVGSRLKRSPSKSQPALVSKGNFARIIEPIDAEDGEWRGMRSALALGRRRNPGHESSVGMPHSSKILVISCTSFLPWKSGSRMRSSPNMHPTLHMSTARPYSFAPSRSSGARYQSVTTSCVSFGGGSPTYLAIPKSAILSCPWLLSKRFDVLRSRWRIQFSWR